jgi:hypothetical protein
MIQTLMSVDGDGTGDFVNWLKELGLSDSFLRDYPIAQLVEWGWLRPQFRIVFPSTFFDQPASETFTWPPQSPQPKTVLEQVWLNEWRFQGEQEAMWFVHPFFRLDSEEHKLFERNSAAAGLPARPPFFEHADGRSISPCADYYFPWQAYALIDVIRAADIFPQSQHFLNAPDVQKRAQSLLKLSKPPLWDPRRTLNAEREWAAWSEPLTWLAHYTALKEIVESQEMRHGDYLALLRRGAKQLAAHLGIDAAQLEAAVREKLLTLADNWIFAVDRKGRWVTTAYPYLQKEIYLAVHWLCMLTDNNLDDYFWRWRNTSQQNEGWAELHAVLPSKYYTDREYFLRQAPYYLKDFNTRLTKKYRLENEHLAMVVKGISRKSRHFSSFLSSFRKLHEELGNKPKKPGGIDFRNRNPLDYYLLLAIRAETCFRAELQYCGKLGTNASLESYLRQLSIGIGLDDKATKCFNKKDHREMTKLHDTPPDFIERISRLMPEEECSEVPIVQAMLCCLAARNYFAHHDYHDDALLNHKSSQFLLGGILLAVLTLLNGKGLAHDAPL